ncbi:MAG: hypothetical protein LBR38_01605, partial [Synergistaceae bacterium]|nr:hypothetical protein [Synergistaceae bacterium]
MRCLCGVMRDTAHIFDLVLKRLMRLSGRAVVCLINGLFGTRHPLDASVEYPNVETVSDGLRQRLSDMMIIVNKVHVYHIEGEVRYKVGIVLRIFEYGYASAINSKVVSGDGRVVELTFPDAIV